MRPHIKKLVQIAELRSGRAIRLFACEELLTAGKVAKEVKYILEVLRTRRYELRSIVASPKDLSDDEALL